MKLLSYNLSDINRLEDCLEQFRRECPKNASSVLCMVITSLAEEEQIAAMARRICKALPEVQVCGTSTSGEIGDGCLHKHSHELCFYVFESSSVEVHFYDGSEPELIKAADDIVRRAEEKRPVAIGTIGTLKSLKNTTEVLQHLHAIPEDIAVFGGSSDSYEKMHDYVNIAATYVFAGEQCTSRGLLALFFYGENLHIHIDSYLGWRPLGIEARITGLKQDKDTHVMSVDNMPITSFYEKYIGVEQGPEFFDSVLPFPLMLNRHGHDIARIPIDYSDDGSMCFSSGIKKGEAVRLGYGDPRYMLRLGQLAKERLMRFRPEGILLMPCVIRSVYLRDDFQLELRHFGEIAPTVGFLSYGEVRRFQDCDEPQLMNGAMLIVGFREGSLATSEKETNNADNVNDSFTDERITLASGLAHFVSVTTKDLENKHQELMIKEREKREAEETARKAAISANEAKTAFLFNMSHDIRTPMNAIIGFTNLLENSLDNKEKSMDYIKKIQESNMFLLSLINNVLEMARIESGKSTVDEGYGNIREMLDSVGAVFETQSLEKQISFECRCEAAHNYIWADLTKIREILLNLLSNAFKYTMEGGRISLRIRELKGTVTGFDLKPGYGVFETTVSDTGIGMPEEFLSQLYEPFTREKNTTQSGIQGTGLGMMIVKKLVDLQGGTIDVRSRLGEGTTFVIRLQHRLAEAPENQRTRVAERVVRSAHDVTAFEGMRVLLAEDNDLNAEIAQFVLEQKGFRVCRAVDGVECVSLLESAATGYYDFILMDVQMPRMDGYEAVRFIRRLKDRTKASIPVLAMTANAFDEDKCNALLAGMNGHIAKPFDVDIMCDTIYQVLKHRGIYVRSDVMERFERKYKDSGCPVGYFIYRCDANDDILFVSKDVLKMYGCETESEFRAYTGGSFRGMVHADDIHDVRDAIDAKLRGAADAPKYMNYRIVAKDGRVRCVTDVGHMVLYGDEQVYCVAMADITDLKA